MGFLTGEIKLNFYNDAADTEFPLINTPNITRTFKSSNAAEVQTTIISLDVSATQAISLNGLDTITGLYLFSQSTDITVSINGLAAITIKAGIAGFMPMVITSLSITNTSASTATTVEVLLVKES